MSLLSACIVRADSLLVLTATTLPSAQDSEMSRGQIRSFIEQLGSDDGDVRDQARQQLLELGRDDLPALKAAAEAEAPLSPEQIEGVREVALEAWLTLPEPVGALIGRAAPSGKLGIYWNLGCEPDCDRGVIVNERFTPESYRKLLPGDIIVNLQDQPTVGTLVLMRLKAAVDEMRPGDVAHLQVMRDGRLISVPVMLAMVPPQLSDPNSVVIWLQHQERDFQNYWNVNFRDLGPGAAIETSD